MALEQIAFNIAAFKDAYANGANYYANKLYAVHKLDDTLADIYSDPIGAYPIQQNGQDNKSDASGEVVFYIDPLGDYYIQVDGKRRDLKFSSAFVKRDEVDDIIESNGEVTTIGKDLNQALDDILALRDESDGTIKPNLQLETIKREDSDKALFDTAAALAQFRRESNSEINNLTDATFVVDPASGTINLRAFNYADDKFTQAGILIDGVDARVSINAGKITDLGTSVINANASIDVLAGQIELKASYTQMTEYVAGALDAITPAYSFSFFNSFEGWSAVNGVMTQGNSFISATFGDIQNQALSYPADENPVITISIKRIAGSGHKGDLIVTFSGGSTQTYSGVITDSAIGEAQIKTLNLKENATYTGDVTGVRLVLGASVADEYQVNSITIGKPSAQLDALDGITAQVNQLGIDVNAIEGQLTSFVTTTFYNQNTVTLNNVTQVLDGEDAIISLKATQQELDSAGTVTKANSAATWIDGANATIRNTVVSFNAEPGSVDDQLAGLTGGLNSVQQEVSALDGASIRNQLISVNRLETKSKDIEELQFYTELKLLEQRNKDLEIGDSVATADSQIKTLTTDTQGLAQEITELKASTGVLGGQINANVTEIAQANTRIDGTANAIAGLTTRVENTEGEVADAQVILDSTVDELGIVSSRAFLGVSNTVGGKTTITGITANSATNGLRFQGDVIQFDDGAGNPALSYDSSKGKWGFVGDGDFSGTLTAPVMNGGKITGGQIITDSGTGTRGEFFDDGNYLLWMGSGSKTDTNATFFIKKNGTGFIKRAFFQGQISETKYAEGATSASVTHKSEANPVEITVTSSGSGYAITSNAPSPVGSSTYSRDYTLKRDGTTIKSGTFIVTRVVERDVSAGSYTTRDYYSFATTFLDTYTTPGIRNYLVTTQSLKLSSPNQEVSLKTYENLME